MRPPSITKQRRHRAKLTLLGLSYRAFAETHGFNERTVKAAVRGERRSGKMTRQIITTLEGL